MQLPTPDSSGFAEALDGLAIHYEIFGEGEPLVMLAGGLMDIASMAQIIGPLSSRRQVIGIDLEGHGRTGLRDGPMSRERLGDDIAAVLRHLHVPRADVAGYSHGGAAALRMAIQHPRMVRRLVLISTVYARDGWYPEARQSMSALGGKLADQLKAQMPMFRNYGAPERIPEFLDRMGELLSEDYDWSDEAAALSMPVLLIYSDHDSISMKHIFDFFALLGGGVSDPGWMEPRLTSARLAIIPGHSHFNLWRSPLLVRIIEDYLAGLVTATDRTKA